MNKLPTIKEIAKRLHVSASTVSRALHNHPSIGWVTTMRVHKIALELNYIPNQTAISFKQKKTFTIGLVLPRLSEAFFAAALSGIEDYASARNYNVLIGQSLDNAEREFRIIEGMKTHRVDGMIVSVSQDTENFEFLDDLKRLHIPIVFFDRIPNLPHINYAACNLEPGIMQAMDYLIGVGHSRIALINGPVALLSTTQRLEIYSNGLKKGSLEIAPELIVYSDLSAQSNHSCMKVLLNLPSPPTAVITFNDYVALDAIETAKAMGQLINKDICFVSFANMPIWNYMDYPPVASIEQFPYKQGEKATEILFNILDMEFPESALPVHYLLDSKMISRNNN